MYGGHVASGQVVEGPWAAALSEQLGRPIRLVRFDGPGNGHDRAAASAGATLLSLASLERLADEAGVEGPVDPRRFRMLIGVDGATAHEEDGWIGKRVRVGEAVIVPGGNVGRCKVTTMDPDTGIRDLDTLEVLARYRARSGVEREARRSVSGRVSSAPAASRSATRSWSRTSRDRRDGAPGQSGSARRGDALLRHGRVRGQSELVEVLLRGAARRGLRLAHEGAEPRLPLAADPVGEGERSRRVPARPRRRLVPRGTEDGARQHRGGERSQPSARSSALSSRRTSGGRASRRRCSRPRSSIYGSAGCAPRRRTRRLGEIDPSHWAQSMYVGPLSMYVKAGFADRGAARGLRRGAEGALTSMR